LWGAVFPPRALPPMPAEDGRTHALRALRQYVSELTFMLNMGPGVAPKSYRLEPSRFLIEWPDSIEQLLYPSVVCMPGVMETRGLGLGVSADESTRDLYGAGTVLVPQHEHHEQVKLHVHASTKAQRRMVAACLESAFSPTEDRSGIVFSLPAYYDQTCGFLLVERNREDGVDNAARRRTEDLTLELQMNIVRLVRYVPLQPLIQIGSVTEVNR
jgi:hypothetical protein